jgi:ActR/RegA family two-component response regulator
MPSAPTILFVDDDQSVRITLAQLLQDAGFSVTTAETVPQALTLIGQSAFDVLISDLNIGHPADGFIVVSAMRRTHPECLTLILTGYPDFETALEAIRHNVNDYLIKPTPIEELIAKIEAGLANRQPHPPSVKPKLVPDVIEENKDSVLYEWFKNVSTNPELMRVELSDTERRDHVPELLDEAVAAARGQSVGNERQTAAARHGTYRYQQGYSVPMLIWEARLLQHAIADCVRRNLLLIDMTHLVSGLTKMWDTIAAELQESARAFVREGAARSMRRPKQ